jgi:hypothetical protein
LQFAGVFLSGRHQTSGNFIESLFVLCFPPLSRRRVYQWNALFGIKFLAPVERVQKVR